MVFTEAQKFGRCSPDLRESAPVFAASASVTLPLTPTTTFILAHHVERPVELALQSSNSDARSASTRRLAAAQLRVYDEVALCSRSTSLACFSGSSSRGLHALSLLAIMTTTGHTTPYMSTPQPALTACSTRWCFSSPSMTCSQSCWTSLVH